MEGHTFLSWNLPNFVSVALMAAVLYAILHGVKMRMNKNA